MAEQIAQERDAAEREAREKETRVLSLTREIDEMNDKVEELERGRRQLQAELDELVNNQGTADKNVSFMVHGMHIISEPELCNSKRVERWKAPYLGWPSLCV